ncbi:MAG: thrombospondin type 3 repeat-containing protein, partial [Pseudomonadota bacterium]
GNAISAVNRFLVRCTEIRLDDLKLLTAIPDGWDSDYDGLSDAEEKATYGTSPYNKDCDDDGLSDGQEVSLWGGAWNGDGDNDGLTNLLDPDSDNDGFTDGTEAAAGSDPGNPASVPSVTMDFEDGTTQGWYIASGLGVIKNIADLDNGTRVMELRGSRTSTMYGLVRQDGTPWHDNVNKVFSWKMKYAEMYYIYVDVVTEDGHRYMYYTPHEVSYLSLGEYVHHGLGAASKDGTWKSFTRDLAADLAEAEPGNVILEVNRFLIRGTGRVDDVTLSPGLAP